MTRTGLKVKCLVIALITLVVPMLCPGISTAIQAILTDDAYTSSDRPAGNFGNRGSLNIEHPTVVPFKTQGSYIKFSLIPPMLAGTVGDDVERAILKLFVGKVRRAGSFDVVRVTGAWTENAITDATAPSLGATEVSGVALTASDENAYVAVDLTALVKAWLDGLANNGVALVPNGLAGLSAQLDSKENMHTSHEPQLEIVMSAYVGPAGSIEATGPVGMTFRGAWVNSTPYVTDDVVTYGGETWIGIASSVGVTPGPALCLRRRLCVKESTTWVL